MKYPHMACKYLSLSAALLFSACEPAREAGPIHVAVSGEELAREGIPYTPAPREGQPVLVDGWTIKFSRWLVVVSNVRLNEPGPDPDQQRVVGAPVAEQTGPWVVDLVRPASEGPDPMLEGAYLFSFQQRRDGRPLDTTVRYAFSFDIAPATAAARPVNLDEAGQASLREMVRQGYSSWVEGTATRDEDRRPPFDSYPTKVNFRFGWGGTVSYLNCSNPDNGNDEQLNRGVQPRRDGPQRAVITVHTEHLFYDELNVEGPNLRFDPMAARARREMSGEATVTLDDLAQAMVVKLTDSQGRDVPDRGNLPGYRPRMGALSYKLNGTPNISTLRDFVIFSAQSMGHFNGEGLCHVGRR